MLLDLSNGTRVSIETNATELNITFLQPDVNHTVFVVAYGGDLPSESIDIAIPQGKYSTLSVFSLTFINSYIC